LIFAKSQEDKYNFFRGFAEKLPTFSIRVLRSKVLPLIIQEVRYERKFATVLIPLIFEIGRTLDKSGFYDSILLPLGDILTSPDPPQCLLAVLNCLPIIIDFVEDGRHYELCYPIVEAGLACSIGSQLHAEVLKHMPLMVRKMADSTVDSVVVPALIELFSVSDDAKVVSSCVRCLVDCLPKLNHDSFAERVVPRIRAAWNRLGRPPELAEACLTVMASLSPTIDRIMEDLVPLASDLLAEDRIPPPTQLKFCVFIKEATEAFLRGKKPGVRIAKPETDATKASVLSSPVRRNKRSTSDPPKPDLYLDRESRMSSSPVVKSQ
jgi:hypothetical protein